MIELDLADPQSYPLAERIAKNDRHANFAEDLACREITGFF
jgi:hypothetical protein